MSPLEAGYVGLIIGVVVTSIVFWVILEMHKND